LTDIASDVFSPSELRSLRSLPTEQLRRRFFELWTLKESYLKARGVGLTLPLHEFSLLIGNGGIGIEFAEELHGAPDAWQFWLSYPSANHVLALGLRKSGRSELTVKIRETTLLTTD
jgi:4'-phosphopantetheinyl transferase